MFFLHVRLHWLTLLVVICASILCFFYVGELRLGQSVLALIIKLLIAYVILGIWHFRTLGLAWMSHLRLKFQIVSILVCGGLFGAGIATQLSALTIVGIGLAVLATIGTLGGYSRLESFDEFDQLYSLLIQQNKSDHLRNSGLALTSQVMFKVKTVARPLPAARHSPAEDGPQSLPLWLDDQFFAEQRVAGLNPLLLRRCDTVPDGYTSHSGVLGVRLPPAPAAQSENFAPPWRVFAPVQSIFQSQSNPLNEQVGKIRVEATEDADARWLLVKLIVQAADSPLHLSVHHLACTHFLMEPIVLLFATRTSRLPTFASTSLPNTCHKQLWAEDNGRISRRHC